MIPAHNIYIHVPFCMSKCNYCAFFSRACPTPDWDTYANEIISEIKQWEKILGKINVPTVFFGGGTPSLMPANIFDKIMSQLHSCFTIQNKCEITLESNPGTINENKLDDFLRIGVNRISVGVQSLRNEVLQFLGRQHSVNDAIKLIDACMQRGISVSADFIYGIPGDTTNTVAVLCKQINSMGLQHCSMYELTIEPNTPFGKMNLDMPTNDEMADMYTAIGQTLNLPRYEVSNYANKGFECKHNLIYWQGDDYIGIGPSAHGRIKLNNKFYALTYPRQQEQLSAIERAEELLLMGLRLSSGIDKNKFKQICNIELDNFINSDACKELCSKKLLINTQKTLRPSAKGLLFLDYIIKELCP